MEARRRSRAPVLPLTFALIRPNSPTRHSSSPSSSSAFNVAVHKTLSPTLASFSGGSSYSSASAAASSSANFALDRSASQVRSSGLPISPKGVAAMKTFPCAPPRMTCMCSPTNHPGSFRCSLHRNTNISLSSTQSQLNATRSAMTNSLARIGGVEGEPVRRALAALMRPSSHHMRRRSSFQPRPSRLWHMITAPADRCLLKLASDHLILAELASDGFIFQHPILADGSPDVSFFCGFTHSTIQWMQYDRYEQLNLILGLSPAIHVQHLWELEDLTAETFLVI